MIEADGEVTSWREYSRALCKSQVRRALSIVAKRVRLIIANSLKTRLVR